MRKGGRQRGNLTKAERAGSSLSFGGQERGASEQEAARKSEGVEGIGPAMVRAVRPARGRPGRPRGRAPGRSREGPARQADGSLGAIQSRRGRFVAGRVGGPSCRMTGSPNGAADSEHLWDSPRRRRSTGFDLALGSCCSRSSVAHGRQRHESPWRRSSVRPIHRGARLHREKSRRPGNASAARSREGSCAEARRSLAPIPQKRG